MSEQEPSRISAADSYLLFRVLLGQVTGDDDGPRDGQPVRDAASWSVTERIFTELKRHSQIGEDYE